MAESMTGYGRGEQTIDDCHFLVEIKSVNNRYGDVQVRSPRVLMFLESKIKETVLRELTRGKIDVFITLEDMRSDGLQIQVNRSLASSYSQALCEIAELTGRPDQADVCVIAKFPEVIMPVAAQWDPEVLEKVLFSALQEALSGISKMRAQEGDRLAEDMTGKVGILSGLREILVKRAPMIPQEYRKRLTERMQELSVSDLIFDESRKAAEVVIFADKCCVDEELVRLDSHFNQLRNTLQETGAIGKRIDFLLQEINREINTIGSKSNDLQMTDAVLQMKTELEKIREQVQNLV